MKRILTTFVLFLVILLSAGTVLLLGNSILDAIRQPSGLKAENASGGGLLLMSEEETSKALETTTQEPRSFEEGASSLKIASEASEAVSAQEEPEEEGRAEAEQEGETGYAYEQLDGEERTLYLELLRAIIGFDENAQLSVWNLETIDRVFACVLAESSRALLCGWVYLYGAQTGGGSARRHLFCRIHDDKGSGRKQEGTDRKGCFTPSFPPDRGYGGV